MMIAASTIFSGCLTHKTDINDYLEVGYKPVVVEGRIARETEQDPIDKTYRKIWVLIPNRPLTVKGFSYENHEAIWYKDVRTMQMAMDEGGYDKWSDFVDTDVKVTGTLFQGISRWHYTDILISIIDIKKP
jgi:hypothetical protein